MLWRVSERVSSKEVAKGSSGRVWFRRGFSKAVSKRVFREGFREVLPEGFEGVSERVPSGLASEGVSGRLPQRAALVVGLEIDGSDLNGEFGPSETLGVTLAIGFKLGS